MERLQPKLRKLYIPIIVGILGLLVGACVLLLVSPVYEIKGRVNVTSEFFKIKDLNSTIRVLPSYTRIQNDIFTDSGSPWRVREATVALPVISILNTNIDEGNKKMKKFLENLAKELRQSLSFTTNSWIDAGSKTIKQFYSASEQALFGDGFTILMTLQKVQKKSLGSLGEGVVVVSISTPSLIFPQKIPTLFICFILGIVIVFTGHQLYHRI